MDPFFRLVPSAKTLLFLVITLQACLITSVEGSDDNGGGTPNFDAFGGDKPCPAYRCSKGMTPVPKSRLKFTSKGCGAMGSGVMMMGMGSGNEKYSSCCDLWHACYQTCGASKQGCDDGFKQCSKVICGPDDDCVKSADLNTMMLNMGGCSVYDQAQYQACECVEKSKVEEKRADAIRYFYKKHAPDNVDKAKQLAKKADTTSKMAGLIKKLVAKYPKCIAKIQDPQQAMYERMMKESKKESDDGSANKKTTTDSTEEDDIMESDETQEL